MLNGNPEGTGDADVRTAALLGLMTPDEDTDIEAEAQDEAFDEIEVDDALDVEEDVEDDGEDVEESERTYKVKVDGQELEVTESELLAGYSRQSDYTKKTTELAEHRKAMQAEFEAVQQERQMYAQYLGQLAQATQPQRPDFEALAQEKGIEAAMQARLQYEGAMERYQAITAEQQAAQQRIAAQQAQAQQEWQQAELDALMNARPEWKDPEAYQQAASEIEAFALDFGYTPDQLAQVSHRDILVLDAARKWIAAKGKAESIKPSQGKVSRPGAKGSVKGKSRARKAQERFRQTGSVNDAADALRAIRGAKR